MADRMPFSTRIRDLINRVTVPLGVRVVRERTLRDPIALFVLKAKETGCRTILDVGANTGQFGAEMRHAGWTGPLVSFEPLTVAHAALQRRAAGDAAWTIPAPCAIGAANGETEINVSANLASSSLLQVEAKSVDVAPGSAFTSVETIRVSTLDDAIPAGAPGPYALKIDTQGYELEVLRGAIATLPQVRVITVEMSITPLYAGGVRFTELFDFLEAAGFRAICLAEGFADYVRNEMLQMEGIFIRD